jgi:glycosyltransferase involved in cell wall biosynthesis
MTKYEPSKKMKILLLNQVFVSPGEPGHTRHFELAQALRRKLHEMVIIASNLNYQTGMPIDPTKNSFFEQDLEEVKVIRIPIYSAIHQSYLSRIRSFLSFMFRSISISMRIPDVDLVMGTTPPLFQALSAWWVAFWRHKPYLLEVRDLWPDFAIDMGVIKNPIVIWLARGLENFLYKRAAKILVNSPAYPEIIEKKGIRKDKIVFIPYGTDIHMFSPKVDGSKVRKDLGIQKEFLVVYTGALGQANDIETVLRAAVLLKQQKNIKIALFGDGKQREKLEANAKRLKLNNAIFAGSRPKKEMPSVVASADACLAILDDIPMFRTTYPNKVFDYMAAGKPTILVIDGVIREVIEKSKGGIFVEPGSAEKLAQSILTLSQNPQAGKKMGLSARDYLVKNFDREQQMQKTIRFLEDLI